MDQNQEFLIDPFFAKPDKPYSRAYLDWHHAARVIVSIRILEFHESVLKVKFMSTNDLEGWREMNWPLPEKPYEFTGIMNLGQFDDENNLWIP